MPRLGDEKRGKSSFLSGGDNVCTCMCTVRLWLARITVLWLAEAEMQMNCKMLWVVQRRGGTERDQLGSGRGGFEALTKLAIPVSLQKTRRKLEDALQRLEYLYEKLREQAVSR